MQNVFKEAFKGQADDENIEWVWPDTDKEGWKVVTDGYQQFYEHWRGNENSTGSKFSNTFPYKLSLGKRPNGAPLLPFHPRVSEDRILVTISYERMFHRLLRLRKIDTEKSRGAVLTGQPGIGKTTFLKFMLARLISLHQVVLLCDPTTAHLFYRGQVYSRSTGPCFVNLPTCRKSRYCPIWALVDMDLRMQEPPFEQNINFWPIQAAPPDHIRWAAWRKQFGAALLGMPLWNMKELMEGLCLAPGYNEFRNRLKASLPLPDEPMLPDESTFPDESMFHAINGEALNAVLKVLQTEREKKKKEEEEEEEEEDCDETGDGTSASATGQDQTMADVTGKPRVDEVDDVLKILVRNATEEFGFAPRDVYDGVFQLPGTRDEHAAAMKGLRCSELVTLVETFTAHRTLHGVSHNVVVVYPSESFTGYDRWKIDFKSPRIAEQVMRLMRLKEDEHLRQTYTSLHEFPEGSTLAGWIFEAIAYRALSGGWSKGPAPQPIRMASDRPDPPTCKRPPTFSTDPPAPGTLPSPAAPLRASTRAVTRVDFAIFDFSDVTLGGDKYYIPTAANNHLFDSFTIDLEVGRHTVVISIFQITSSETHAGSGKGYFDIRKIMTHVRGLLKEQGRKATIEVAYFLVCPNDGSKHEWKMPTGWSEAAKKNNHRGHAFCIRVPALIRHVSLHSQFCDLVES